MNKMVDNLVHIYGGNNDYITYSEPCTRVK
jgi:hypothetical protein